MYEKDAGKLVALITKNATNQELMNLINKDRGSNKEVSEALKNERDKRINKALEDLSSAINPKIASTGVISSPDYEKGTKALSEAVQLGVVFERQNTGEYKITVPGNRGVGQSTTTSIIGIDNVLINWWEGLCKAADVGISFIPAIGDLYDVFTVVSGYSLSGKLTPIERALVIGALVSGINSVPGVSGGALRAVVKTTLENHHLLPNQFRDDFIKMGFKPKELDELLTFKLPVDLHRSKPNGLHTMIINWNKQWEEWIKNTPPKDRTKANALNQLEKMVKRCEIHFTKEGVDEIMKKINQLR